MPDEIRRMPKPEFDPPKRRIPFQLYLATTLPLGIAWYLIDKDRDTGWLTISLAALGLSYFSQGIARLILNEIAISKSLRVMKEGRAPR